MSWLKTYLKALAAIVFWSLPVLRLSIQVHLKVMKVKVGKGKLSKLDVFARKRLHYGYADIMLFLQKHQFFQGLSV